MCGGQLFILPCSRVGHVTKIHDSNDPAFKKALSRNLLRVVHTWLDEYKVSGASDWGERALGCSQDSATFPDPNCILSCFFVSWWSPFNFSPIHHQSGSQMVNPKQLSLQFIVLGLNFRKSQVSQKEINLQSFPMARSIYPLRSYSSPPCCSSIRSWCLQGSLPSYYQFPGRCGWRRSCAHMRTPFLLTSKGFYVKALPLALCMSPRVTPFSPRAHLCPDTMHEEIRAGLLQTNAQCISDSVLHLGSVPVCFSVLWYNTGQEHSGRVISLIPPHHKPLSRDVKAWTQAEPTEENC